MIGCWDEYYGTGHTYVEVGTGTYSYFKDLYDWQPPKKKLTAKEMFKAFLAGMLVVVPAIDKTIPGVTSAIMQTDYGPA